MKKQGEVGKIGAYDRGDDKTFKGSGIEGKKGLGPSDKNANKKEGNNYGKQG